MLSRDPTMCKCNYALMKHQRRGRLECDTEHLLAYAIRRAALIARYQATPVPSHPPGASASARISYADLQLLPYPKTARKPARMLDSSKIAYNTCRPEQGQRSGSTGFGRSDGQKMSSRQLASHIALEMFQLAIADGNVNVGPADSLEWPQPQAS